MPPTAHIRSVQFVCHRTEKIGSTRDFVCRSLNVAPFTWFAVNNDFESMMFWKKKKQHNSLRNTVAKQYKLLQHKLSSLYLVGCEIRKRTLKRKHVVEPTLKWSAVLLIHTGARKSVSLTNIENQTAIWVKHWSAARYARSSNNSHLQSAFSVMSEKRFTACVNDLLATWIPAL